ncbi:MAG: dTDP-4-dehydrorhamnose reductase [Ruminococcus sp.]|nr:dTDP-4-dehydrorhamnose reductase [Ruminococcus sp.]
MKVLVTGVKGQLGYDVVQELEKRNHEAVGVDIEEMDITDRNAVEQVLKETAPDAVIHCAAWTAVDAAEDEDKKDKVRLVNAAGTRNIAEVCKEMQQKLLYLSTDYVFDGQGTKPWEPDCKAYQPLNVYGQTKLEGEKAVSELLDKYFIVRIAWVFGKNGKNFIRTMLNLGKNHDEIRVVNDQIGTPTYTFDLARLLVDMIETEKYGYYHVTNEGGYISWYDFTKEIFRQAESLGYQQYSPGHVKVIPVTTAEYGASKAARPFNSRLDKSKLREKGFTPLPDWKDALARYLKSIEI